MDAIRSRARDLSWRAEYDSPSDRFNPFSRPSRHRPIALDVEAGATEPTSEPAPAGSSANDHSIIPEGEHELQPTLINGVEADAIQSLPKHGETTNEKTWSENDYDDEGDWTRTKRERKERMARKIPVGVQIRMVLLPQWWSVNWLLLLVPVGFALNYAHVGAIETFIVNFVVIFPLAIIVVFAGRELSMRLGESSGTLMFVSISNVPQLVIAIILLVGRDTSNIRILKATLIGSIVSNLHLLLGLGFLAGGVNRLEQYYNISMVQTSGMLLLLATMALVVPTLSTFTSKSSPSEYTALNVNQLSRGTAIALLFLYIIFIFFRIKSHRSFFNAPSQKVSRRKTRVKDEGDAIKALAQSGARVAALTGGQALNNGSMYQESEEDEELPSLSLVGGFITLILATVLLAFHTEFTTNNFTAVTGQLSSSFIGMVLLPLFAIDPGCITTSSQDKQDENVDTTLGKCIQTALVVAPILVILGWIMGIEDMNLLFDTFEVGTVMMSVIIVNYITNHGKSNWLQGAVLIIVFVVISLAAFYTTD